MGKVRHRESFRNEPRVILWADADEQKCALFRTHVPRYRIVTAVNGGLALALAKRVTFDAYIVSTPLLGLGAPELCRAIRQFDPKTPIISYGCEACGEERKAMLESGAQSCLVWPLDEIQLESMIDAAVQSNWLDSVAAKLAVHTAILEQLNDRSVALATRTQASWKESEQLREHLLKLKAYRAFIDAGGARSNFKRLWPDMADSLERKFGVKPKMPA